ncbi:MAG: carbon-nitrogen hydrolase family protein [Cyclobacteriaceae bacterium]
MNHPRRNFLKKSAIGLGAVGALPVTGTSAAPSNSSLSDRLPREVWIATLTQDGIEGNSLQEIIDRAIAKMEFVLPQQPDIICLPETFQTAKYRGKLSVTEVARQWEGPLTEAMSNFAKQHSCHLIAPIHTLDNGKVYNAAVVFDREGKRIGEYRKVRTTEDEMGQGVSPGTPDPPVFKTDFGTIGIQICFDVEWMEGWRQLRQKGAEIVFWPSAFGGGKKINTMAWLNKYCVVSSTWKGTTKICDITGEEVAGSGSYNRWGVCAPVNLEKAFLHSWPYSRQFPAIQAKYGRKVRIYTLHEEEFSIIESCSPDIKVADILQEFNLKTYEEHIQSSAEVHDRYWNS